MKGAGKRVLQKTGHKSGVFGGLSDRYVPWLLGIFMVVGLIFCLASLFGGSRSSHGLPPKITIGTASAEPRSLKELLSLAPNHLEGVDVGRMNLLCAEGLPGCEQPRLEEGLATLDKWARDVEVETKRHAYRFQSNPAEFNNSEGYFRILMMITVLQQDDSVRYNPARISSPDSPEPDSSFFCDSRDLFLHGIIGPRALGTCVSMPVFYVAVGRRLGYPLKLTTAKGHLFARWESPDGKDRFNIEGTNQGLNTPEDDFYRTWPYQITDEESKAGAYLRSLAPAEELAIFLQTRGNYLRVTGSFAEAKAAYLQAQDLAPRLPENGVLLELINRQMVRRIPSHAELDALADYARALNEHNRQSMQSQGIPQAGVAPSIPPLPPVPPNAPYQSR